MGSDRTKKTRLAFISLLYLAGGLAVFVFGNPFYDVFPTNGSLLYNLILVLFLLMLAIGLKRSRKLQQYYPPTYALFMAAAAMLFLTIGPFNIGVNSSNQMLNLSLDKLFQFIHVVPILLILWRITGDSRDAIFLQTRNTKKGLVFGITFFLIFLLVAALTYFSGGPNTRFLLTQSPWILLFIFSNAMMEEIWFRAIFLKKYQAIVGRWTGIIITSIVFGAPHIFADYSFPGGGILFGFIVCSLGLVGSWAMFREDGLIGPILFHAGYDLIVIIPVLSS